MFTFIVILTFGKKQKLHDLVNKVDGDTLFSQGGLPFGWYLAAAVTIFLTLPKKHCFNSEWQELQGEFKVRGNIMKGINGNVHLL